MSYEGALTPMGGGYAEQPKACRMATLQERLDMAVNQAEERLADAKTARDILKANPDLEKLLNIMQKGQF